ncbi:MAG TPA: hypothetical protein VGC97_05605, partial [Pyrinomonadaceae bacterium]
MNITPVGPPIHQDFFTVSGGGFTDNAILEFNTTVGIIRVKPDYISPHLALVERLPVNIPTGNATLQMTAPGVPSSNSVAITVAAAPAQTVRMLQAGDTKERPYTIVFVANPAIEAVAGGSFSADPILTNRSGFHRVVGHSFHNIFNVAEDLFKQNNFDSRVRVYAVFDPTRPVNAQNALAHEILPNLMETRRTVLRPFLSTFGITADMVFVVHGSTQFNRATAWFTSDDAALGGTAYTFDGTNRTHGHFPRIPGSAAIPVSVDMSGLTVIHEFGHAASDFNNGRVTDLYDDGNGGGFFVNKKFRAAVGNPVPGSFAGYNGTNFNSELNRDG